MKKKTVNKDTKEKAIKNNPHTKELRNSLISILFGILLFGGCFVYYRYLSLQIETDSAVTKGIIIGYQGISRGDCNIKFEFIVSGVRYVSSEGYSIKYDRFSLGDTCFVKYARSNPENCKLVTMEVDGHTLLKLNRHTDNSLKQKRVFRYLQEHA